MPPQSAVGGCDAMQAKERQRRQQLQPLCRRSAARNSASSAATCSSIGLGSREKTMWPGACRAGGEQNSITSGAAPRQPRRKTRVESSTHTTTRLAAPQVLGAAPPASWAQRSSRGIDTIQIVEHGSRLSTSRDTDLRRQSSARCRWPNGSFHDRGQLRTDVVACAASLRDSGTRLKVARVPSRRPAAPAGLLTTGPPRRVRRKRGDPEGEDGADQGQRGVPASADPGCRKGRWGLRHLRYAQPWVRGLDGDDVCRHVQQDMQTRLKDQPRRSATHRHVAHGFDHHSMCPCQD